MASQAQAAGMDPRTSPAPPQGPIPAPAMPRLSQPGTNINIGSASPPSSPLPPAEDDLAGDDFFGDQDDAQSFIQPAISLIATRLTSPKTPAAEKAAAMDRLPGGGLFDAIEPSDEKVPSPPATQLGPRSHTDSSGPAPGATSGPPAPNKLVKRPTTQTPGQLSSRVPASSQSSAVAMPAPWKAGPKEMVFRDTSSPAKSAMAGVFGNESGRQQRASSVSENALKRLSKALPSISIPSGFMQNISSPTFFNSISSQSKEQPASSSAPRPEKLISSSAHDQSPAKPSELTRSSPDKQLGREQDLSSPSGSKKTGPARPPSVTSRRSYVIRKSTSDDSLLYHSLSRVSSFGDDERWSHVREQVNSRLKAIKDSFDGPSFKLPQQMTNLLQAPLFKTQAAELSPETPRASTFPAASRQGKDALSPLDAVLETLTGDVVIMGGYRGSILRSAQPPHRQLWVPVKVGLNMRKVNMEVGLDPEDEENMEKHIFASGMLQNIGPVDISKRLFKKLRESENARKGRLRVHDYGYDWRLSPHLLSRKLVKFLEKLPANDTRTPPEHRGALVIAHSLGGLITRHAVNQRPELFSGVIYAGTPQRCINILGPLRNGDAVLLNEKVLTAQVNFSLRTTFAFLPEDEFCFVDKTTEEEYPVDFYNVEDWIKYRLCPCIGEPALPPYLSRSNTFSSLLSLSDSLSNLPLRARSNSHLKRDKVPSPPPHVTSSETTWKTTVGHKDRTLAPQMGASWSSATTAVQHQHQTQDPQAKTSPTGSTTIGSLSVPSSQARNLEYLERTLAETKRFRAELAHKPALQAANRYPPLSVIYAKDIPTVYAARVACREAIACADAYDDLVFRSGDGVVLARESMLPPGYELVRGGRVCTDRGHVTILGDLLAVGKALEAVVRGRRKGIGMADVADLRKASS